MASLKNESDDSDLGIFLLSGLMSIVFLGIRYDISFEFVLFSILAHVIGSSFIWRKVERWWFVLWRNWKWRMLTLLSPLFAGVLLMIAIALLSFFLELYLGIPPEKSGFLGVIVACWLIAFFWPLVYRAWQRTNFW